MGNSIGSAITGIDANQALLDTIGNNIANVNTVGYQSTDLQFADLLYQQQSSAGAPQAGVSGGTNPVVVGSGVRIAASPTDFSQGTLQQTGTSTDVAISGQGFLIASQGGQSYYTRAGNLQLDANGNLVTATGALIQGWVPNATGTISTNSALTNITIPQGQQSGANPTTNVSLSGNLPPFDPTLTTQNSYTATVSIYDSLGNAIPVTFTFTPGTPSGTADPYTVTATVQPTTTGASPLNVLPSGTTINFNPATGQFVPPTGTAPALAIPVGSVSSSVPAAAIASALNFSALTQVAGSSSVAVSSQNGYASGSLEKFTINSDGTIQGSYSNGQSQVIGQIALASFSNNQGLTKVGNLLYSSSPNSGLPQVGTAGTGGRGWLIGGSVETSNVNLGDQLTQLIVAQNAYQANTKVVSTSSTVLQSLVQMA